MKSRFLMSVMLAAAVFCAAPAWAGWHGSAHQQGVVSDKAPKPAKYNITLTIVEVSYVDPGTCIGGEDWADICPSGSCGCATYTGTATGAAGNGSVIAYETIDWGNSWTYNYYESCAPAYGDIEITGSKDTESIAFNGADCGSAWGDVGILSGGCFLQDSTTLFTDLTGGAVGSCSGTYNTNETTKTKFKITGTSLK